MAKMSRKAFVLKNIFAKWISILLITILQFVSRKIFISYFSDDLLGLSGLLQSVIAMLSLLELGVGSAIYYTLYEPLSNRNTEKIIAIIRLYKKIYTYIGCIVLFLGLIMIPFLSRFIDASINIRTVRIAFCIFLIDTASSYFLAYRRNIFNADQKEYFCTNVDTVTTALGVITQILFTIFTHNYYLYLVGKVIWTISANIIIYISSSKKYRYINKDTNYVLPLEYMQEFKKNLKTLCISNVSSYLVFGTDNLLISNYVNIGSVFIYSNYSTIVNTVNKLLHNIFDSAQASAGNYVVNNDVSKAYKLFDNIFFINYMVTCFSSVSLVTMLNPFIKIWLGNKYVWPLYIVIILVANNYFRFINQTIALFRNAIGLYSPYSFYKYWGFVEGIVNIVASLLFVHLFKDEKIIGVFLGTTVSTIFVFSFNGIHALFKYYFGIEKLKEFARKYIVYILLTVMYSCLTLTLFKFFKTDNDYIKFAFSAIISIVIPNALNFMLFGKSSNFAFIKSVIFPGRKPA